MSFRSPAAGVLQKPRNFGDGDMGYVRSHWRRSGFLRRHFVRSHYRSNPRRNNMIVVVAVLLIVLLVIAVLTSVF